MMMKTENDKNVVIGVSGGIAAYKACQLVSTLTQRGFNVKVVMTSNAQRFVCPLTFQTLSGNRVYTDLWSGDNDYDIAHISLADWAGLLVLVPATANIIGKVANGIADDLLSCLCLSITAPIWVVPSMNVNMWNNKTVQDNIKKLTQRGCTIIEPAEGYLACGTTGKGRLPEVETILAEIENHFA